jgi:hypothetical protein
MFASCTDVSEATERIEAEVCTLAAQIAAATCRMLLLIAELDRRMAWASWGCRSMAHWLAYRCGTSLSTAREQVRVGRALADLPETTAAFAAGTLSYSKVRALVRIATAETERDLIQLAHDATASQLERIVSTYLRTTHETEVRRLRGRQMHTYIDDDGARVVTMRFADSGDAFMAAVGAAVEQVPLDEDADDPIAARRLDACELVALAFLAGDESELAPPTELVLHGDLALLNDEEHGETLRMLACDATLSVQLEERGRAIAVAPSTRTIPRALRRAILRRDGRCCRFPGCTNRTFLHIHHLIHVASNGPTERENLMLLCTFHHRLVHVGGWRVRGRASDALTFTSGDRAVSEHSPPLRANGRLRQPGITPRTIATATGEKCDMDLTMTALVSKLPTHPN